ncbi:hemolysin III [Salipiger sp. IMCC34102]|uniref:PAQR family membrane homeostasis protein TrhA n=1 Tax=Salipiger sp. IMCC34102 TaxID=2510647 RepID=UPI00101C0384|nr:hemolysin III family protein [Salipiger sp. IMCC34102]RYH02248.1 hemolysin III [Salipiger sp. IMCC34102]
MEFIDVYPAYARSERIADGVMHALGIAFALAGSAGLLVWAAMHAGPGQMTALAVYAFGLMATFLASGLYHMTPWVRIRPVLRRIDHAAIYVMIAGTLTPLAVLADTGLAYGVLACVWALAALGVARKLFFWAVPGRLGPLTYLAMGLTGLVLLRDLWGVLPAGAIWLMGAGGALYVTGIAFYSAERLKFSTAIWHGFVVAASVCFYAAIALGAATTA